MSVLLVSEILPQDGVASCAATDPTAAMARIAPKATESTILARGRALSADRR
jgi:hypothetical protein